MLCKSLIAAHYIVPSDLSRVQNHEQLKLIESHNSFAVRNHVVHLLMLGKVQMIRQTGVDNVFQNF